MGIEVIGGDCKEWIRDHNNFVDYYYLHRPDISTKYIDEVKSSNAKIIYQGHDLHYVRFMREYDITKEPNSKKRSDQMYDMEYSMLSNSDMNYYFSDAEINTINKHKQDIEAKKIPLYIFDSFKKPEYDPSKRKNIFYIGSYEHHPNVLTVIRFVEEIWPSIHEYNNDIKFYILGSNVPDEIKALASKNIIVVGYVSDRELEEYYKSCRMLVVPLLFGGGVKGKIIESMYNGIPVITTPTGLEGIDSTGPIVTNHGQEFANEFNLAYSDNEKLMECSRKSFDYVVKNFSFQSAFFALKDDFELGNDSVF